MTDNQKELETPLVLGDGTVVLWDNTCFQSSQNSRKVLEFLTQMQLESEEDIIVLPFTNVHKRDEGGSNVRKSFIKRTKEGFRTYNLVGFLHVKGKPVSIVSRFSQGNDLSTDFFFNYMLSKSEGGFTLLNPEVSTDFSRMDSLSIYAAIFVHWLKNALQKGILKEYVRNFYNDSNVHGVIDIPRHIRQNVPFVGKIAYTQREHSTDNVITELVRHTIEFLSTRPVARPWLDQATDEIRQIREVTPRYRRGDLKRIVERSRNHPVRHAYYQEYRDLQRICLQILQYESFIYGGGDGRTFGILFDCSALWEGYLATLLKGEFYHPDNLNRRGTQYLFEIMVKSESDEGRPSSRRCFPIYPDFISRKTPRVIADAKYKSIEFKENDENDRDDFYQVLSYMLRFDANVGFLLYPDSLSPSVESEEDPDSCSSPVESEEDRMRRTFHLLNGIDDKEFSASGKGENGMVERSERQLIKLAMGIPSQDGLTFEEFGGRMRKAEEALIDVITAELN